MILCIGLALLAAMGSIVAWSFTGGHAKSAHAAGIAFTQTTGHPWGMALDGGGNLWVAEPNCDGNPACGLASPAPVGLIGEYSATSFTKIKDFVPAAPTTASKTYNPMFVAVSGGVIWFTDPSHGAIGKLIPASNTWTEYPLGKGAIPVDLTFDGNGNLWYTDFGTNSIGLFNTATGTAKETATPTANSSPYGITAHGQTVWFTENSANAVGSFTGSAGAITITEHKFPGVSGTTPHLITTDATGNAWFSTGFGGQVGEVAGANVNLFCVSNNVTGPHISGIGVDSTGKVWFDDSTNARLGYLTPSAYQNDCSTNSTLGVTYTLFPGGHTHDGLVVDGHDNVFFGEEFNNQIGEVPAGTALPPPPTVYPPGPTSKTWYFAEGRVGTGFQEFLTIGNPSPSNNCIVDIQYLKETGTSTSVKVTVPADSRKTESVNGDLGVPSTSGTGVSVATLLTNDAASPCAGFAVERPMYFNYHGNQSDSDVVGATHTANTFYFADVPSGGGYTSYITILNPPGGQTASVTASYYAGGHVVGTQTVSVSAGMRGTIAPGAISLPQHTAVVVSSTAPVVVERPTYFAGVNGGVAGSVTGASSVVGSQQLQHEYFFAEGYAGRSPSGGYTQENLVISNVDSTVNGPANVTINLEYLSGAKHPFTVTVPAMSQVIWNVNTQGTNPASNEVSADVTSTGAGIVVSRQMFFQYAHTLPRATLHVTGGTEVTGMTGLGANGTNISSYTFAEGYSNNGYNEWLTLQNPTATAETIYITMVNSNGRVFNMTVAVGANTRATVDVTAQVLNPANHLVIVPADYKEYEISMTVQTINAGGLFVAERPMYENNYGISSTPTQGGTDAFGYAGQ